MLRIGEERLDMNASRVPNCVAKGHEWPEVVRLQDIRANYRDAVKEAVIGNRLEVEDLIADCCAYPGVFLLIPVSLAPTHAQEGAA